MGPRSKLISLKEERSKLDLCLLACMNKSDKQSERADHVKSCFCLLVCGQKLSDLVVCLLDALIKLSSFAK